MINAHLKPIDRAWSLTELLAIAEPATVREIPFLPVAFVWRDTTRAGVVDLVNWHRLDVSALPLIARARAAGCGP